MVRDDILRRMLTSEAMHSFVSSYNTAAAALLTFTTLVVLIMTVFNIVRLARAADNPGLRAGAIRALLVCFVSLAVLGSLETVYALAVGFILGT